MFLVAVSLPAASARRVTVCLTGSDGVSSLLQPHRKAVEKHKDAIRNFLTIILIPILVSNITVLK